MMHRFHTAGVLWTTLRFAFVGWVLFAHASFALTAIAAPTALCGAFAPCEYSGHKVQASHATAPDVACADSGPCAMEARTCPEKSTNGEQHEHGGDDAKGCCGSDCFECLRCASGPLVDTAPEDNGTTLPVRHALYSLVETPISLHFQPLHNPPRG